MTTKLLAAIVFSVVTVFGAARPEAEVALRDQSPKEIIQWWADNHLTLSTKDVVNTRKELQNIVFNYKKLLDAGIDVFQKDYDAIFTNIIFDLDVIGDDFSNNIDKICSLLNQENPWITGITIYGIYIPQTHSSRHTKNVYIDYKKAEKLAEALKANTSLIYLRLFSHNITHKGAKAIAQALAKNTNLKYLHLGKNEIKSEGAIEIAEALKENKTLEELSLWENGIRSKGIRALAEAIQSNDTLIKLHLSTRARFEISSIDTDILYEAIHKRGQKFNCRSDMKYGLAEGEKQDCFIILDKGYIPN